MHTRIAEAAARTVAVDFDGVLHDWQGKYEPPSDPPIPGALEALKKLVDSGARVVIFSARCCCFDQHPLSVAPQRDEIISWLSKHGAQRDTHYHEVVGCKPVAAVYVDDRAVRFTDWASASEQIALALEGKL